ncbi:RNA methyltransferase, TrmA family [hydrothermal vent metagenome]|uniref:RNA methyltransferase, TrmA family n=1 Tax=hydrothermal vent metagenome TaxID=652676 RepID=A0A3B0RCF0_9ZZZZ
MTKTIKIDNLTYGGDGIGRLDGKAVFVPYGAPGDTVEVKFIKEKKRFAIAELIEVTEPSPLRQDPACPVFGECGGCQWQHISYETQLKAKGEQFTETLKRLAGIEFPEPPRLIASPKVLNYRNRVKIHKKGPKWGFFRAKSHKIVDIDNCPLLDPTINKVFAAIRAFDFPEPLHTLDIALDEATGNCVAAFYLKKNRDFDWEGLLSKVGDLKGIELWKKDPNTTRKSKLGEFGDTLLSYKVAGATILSGTTTFMQGNPEQNKNIVEEVLRLTDLDKVKEEKKPIVIADLFCGAGNLTIPLAMRAEMVVGIDTDGEAIVYAKKAARISGLAAVKFRSEDAEKTKTLEKVSPSVVVLDPPRSGCLEAIEKIIKVMPEKVIYISCAPPTLARDIKLLIDKGYRPARASVLDLFPQTYHIESIVELILPKAQNETQPETQNRD